MKLKCNRFKDYLPLWVLGLFLIGNAGADGYSGPDGYALGSYNVNTLATPTLASAFSAAFLDSRLRNGGIIWFFLELMF